VKGIGGNRMDITGWKQWLITGMASLVIFTLAILGVWYINSVNQNIKKRRKFLKYWPLNSNRGGSRDRTKRGSRMVAIDLLNKMDKLYKEKKVDKCIREQ